MKIKKEVIDKIIEHSKKDAPIEACGYLASYEGIIIRHYPLLNIDRSREHFSFDPKEQFGVLKDIRVEGLEITAVYHSHPVSPARLSQEDIRLAYDSSISYVIVSLAGQKSEVKSFRIKDLKVEAENIEVV
ncbi:MAG: M67 family metallopeptidase [Omnitrophica bacterium]|nr:M67 family metallopeptidase [Candidatus Omnitrophota bacterium]